ncbi:NADH-quinone oxidoreductase subunit NuoH [Desulfurivibrio alkaliphilus]|uniref:NADH-quinone oxidoreductase subunit H n=1 Tax=Desulfurivibrio alkaliphilus (strain DSM 19089 / UNIQEM U267 / AHT2) TaxID=589865 RepID=D6Z4Y1_DESAT|nr:NADH-quinone oxidoreductase subunit NuoH [Desulfurivibrio alkaliphilus]ADH86606.1 NADH dehydrogenase (quinone) [Desulfurivibrio alkaliphilus AHT 2]
MSEMPEIFRVLAFVGGIMALVGLNAAFSVWLERKVAGHIQRRIGPKEVGPFGIIQSLADGIKLMSKQLVVPAKADPILYRLAPALTMITAVMVFVVIPFGPALVAVDLNIGLLLVFAIASVNVLALLMGGWGSNNKYAVISATRAVSQNVAYEVPMLITVVSVVMITGTMNLNTIVGQQQNLLQWYIFPWNGSILLPVAFLIFFVCAMAETNRAPFDLGEAESELVAGFHTEYGGMGFGLFFLGEYGHVFVGCALASILFLGGWQCPLGILPGVHWLLIKTYLLVFVVMWIRWTYPRTTLYGLLNLSWKVLVPFSLAVLVVTAAMLKVF